MEERTLNRDTALQSRQQRFDRAVIQEMISAGNPLEAHGTPGPRLTDQAFGDLDRREVVLITVDDVNWRLQLRQGGAEAI